MVDSCVELFRLIHAVHPAAVKLNELLEALRQLMIIEEGHVQMLRGGSKRVQVVFNPESLQLASIAILADRNALVTRDAVVERSGGGLYHDGSVGKDLWCVPAVCFVPIHGEHMVGKLLTEREIFRSCD